MFEKIRFWKGVRASKKSPEEQLMEFAASKHTLELLKMSPTRILVTKETRENSIGYILSIDDRINFDKVKLYITHDGEYKFVFFGLYTNDKVDIILTCKNKDSDKDKDHPNISNIKIFIQKLLNTLNHVDI